MSDYKFINFENPLEEMNYIYEDSRNTQKIFQRDREIHIVSTVEETHEDYYVIICFFGDRYLCTFALDETDLFWFKADIMREVDYKTIMMDLLAKDAYTDIINFKTLKRIQYGFEEYLKEEFYEI